VKCDDAKSREVIEEIQVLSPAPSSSLLLSGTNLLSWQYEWTAIFSNTNQNRSFGFELIGSYRKSCMTMHDKKRRLPAWCGVMVLRP
jgi:hypothetical protein